MNVCGQVQHAVLWGHQIHRNSVYKLATEEDMAYSHGSGVRQQLEGCGEDMYYIYTRCSVKIAKVPILSRKASTSARVKQTAGGMNSILLSSMALWTLNANAAKFPSLYPEDNQTLV